MATTNYLDLTGLQVYDGLIKNYVTNADAKSIKTVLLDGNNIKFYKKFAQIMLKEICIKNH